QDVQGQKNRALAIGIEAVRVRNCGVQIGCGGEWILYSLAFTRVAAVHELQPVGPCDSLERFDAANRSTASHLFCNLKGACVENPGGCIAAHSLMPVS